MNGPAPTQTEMLTTLASLSYLGIRGHSSAIPDTSSLDNVMLLAPPANNTVLLLSRPHGSQLLFEWPAFGAGFHLQTATTLSPPDWTDVGPAPLTSNGLNTLLISLTNKGQFYRLRKP